MNPIRRLTWRIRLWLKTRDQERVALLMYVGIVADQLERLAGGRLRLHFAPGAWLELPAEWPQVRDFDHIRALAHKGAKFARVDDGRLRVQIDDLVFFPATAEELFILREIFVEGVYHLRLARESVLLDIGGNVGTAALWFARQPLVAQVHTFEPLPDNLARLQNHLAANPEAAKRCVVHPYGLGAKEQTIKVRYLPSSRGSFSVVHGLDAVVDKRLKIETTEAEAEVGIRPARLALHDIASANPGLDIVAKIDCEGAEEEILADLEKADLLGRIRAIIMETHFGNGCRLADLLSRNGFLVFQPQPGSTDLGYIVAFRPANAS